ncbi:MAG: RibD family protein [Rhodospirillales bacterium]|nr:RibD family protein [Rhodospirillales bacterium]
MTPRICSSHGAEEQDWQTLVAVAHGGTLPPKIGSNSFINTYLPLIVPAHQTNSLVIAQIGQSLDGRIATASGHSHYINGPSAITHLHRLRALVDAVVVGVGTALADDPQLTVRRVTGPNPARVVIDPAGRLPATARCLEEGARRVVIGATGRSPRAGVEAIRLPAAAGRFAPGDIVQALADLGLHRILIEGGGMTISKFLDAGYLDRLHVLVAPMIIGSGRAGIQLAEIARLDEAVRPSVTVTTFDEGDVLFDCDLGRRR